MFKIVVIATLFAVAVAKYNHGYEDHLADYYAHPQYEFNYEVNDHHTGDHKSQHEVRDGDVTRGEYSLVEPDGTVRKVEYSVDKDSGFNAVVTRSGHAIHPAEHVARHALPIAHALHHAVPVVHQGVPYAVPVHHAAPAYTHGHDSSFSNLVSHHEPIHHGYYY